MVQQMAQSVVIVSGAQTIQEPLPASHFTHLILSAQATNRCFPAAGKQLSVICLMYALQGGLGSMPCMAIVLAFLRDEYSLNEWHPSHAHPR